MHNISVYARSVSSCISMAAGIALFGPFGGALAADIYEIDPTHTHVQFSIERFGFNDVIGFFPGVKGAVTLDSENPEASQVEAEIHVASLVSGDPTRNDHVKGEFWLNAAEFPMITFLSTAVILEADETAEVIGELTILGQTNPVTLSVTLNKLGIDPATKRAAAGFSATGTIKRSDFGLDIASALIGDEVSIRIETLAHMVTD